MKIQSVYNIDEEVFFMEQTKKLKSTNDRKQPWIPQKERSWVFLSIGIATLILIVGIENMFSVYAIDFHSSMFKSSFKNYGSLARICLFFVLAYYVFTWILKRRMVDHWELLKNGVIMLLRFTRRWHTPIAIISIGLIVLHVVGAFLYGFKFDFNNISGLLALLVLLPVPLSGLFRYRRMDRKWHLRLGLGFAVLFFIHAFL
jgi:hypothetical protein